jgi:S-adenosylmethionine decarboxylase
MRDLNRGIYYVTMRDLEPQIYRQRLIIEGRYTIEISEEVLKQFFEALAEEIGMTLLTKPFFFSPNMREHAVHHGIAGFIAWVESGCSIYTWDKFNFFTVDIYTCKQFSLEKAVEFTEKFFKCREIEYLDITPSRYNSR